MKRISIIIFISSVIVSAVIALCLVSGKGKENDKAVICMAADSTSFNTGMSVQEIVSEVQKEERKVRSLMLAIIILTVTVSYMAVDKITAARRKAEIRNRQLTKDIQRLEKEKEKYRTMYNRVREEKEVLSGMKKEGHISEDMRGIMEERLNVLNRFITSYISGNCSEPAYNELEKLMSDRNTFIESTRLSFAIGHPRFLIFLKEKGLTEMEIGYCCLHAIGLRGKEIVAYLNSRSYYNASSGIRKKLGLNEHDTNINLYIQKLIKDIDENAKPEKQK